MSIKRNTICLVHLQGKVKEERTLETISNARKRVTEEITQVKERLKRHKNAIHALRDEISKIEEAKGAAT